MTRLMLLSLAALVAGPIGCSSPAPTDRSATAPRMTPGSTYSAPATSQAVRDQAAITAACRQEAERIIIRQDRGQLMREDERDNRLGTESSIFSARGEMDRLGRRYELDRMTQQCVRDSIAATPTQPAAQPAPAAPAQPTTTSTRRR